MKTTTKKILSQTAPLIITSLMMFISFPVKDSNAVIPINFGGPITSVIPCGCTSNLLITVGPPVPTVVIYQPLASTLLPFGQIAKIGSFTLGNYLAGVGSCNVVTPAGCVLVPSLGTIFMVGTSI